MNLTACDSCGIVIDLSKLSADIQENKEKAVHYDLGYNRTYCKWNNNTYCHEVTVNCPVCDNQILTGEEI